MFKIYMYYRKDGKVERTLEVDGIKSEEHIKLEMDFLQARLENSYRTACRVRRKSDLLIKAYSLSLGEITFVSEFYEKK